MEKLSAEELSAAHARQDWAVLDAQVPDMANFVLRQLKYDPQNHEDLKQEAVLAGCLAVRSWNPSEYPFATHVITRIRYALLMWFRLNRSVVRSRNITMGDTSLDIVIGEPGSDDPNDLGPNFVDRVAYDEPPEGFAEPPVELERASVPKAVEAFLALAESPGSDVLRSLYGIGRPKQDLAEIGKAHGRTKRCARDHSSRAKKQIRGTLRSIGIRGGTRHVNVESGRGPLRFDARQDCQVSEASRYPGFWHGAAGVMGHGATWRESTGQVFRDWSWKPTAEDIKRGCKP